MTVRRGLALAGLALAAALVAGRVLAGLYADWAWFDALGASSLWRAQAVALVSLRAVLFAASFAFAFANLFAMRRSVVSLVLPRRVANLEIGEAVPGRALTGAAALLSAVIAAAVALPQDDWLGLLRARWATPLGEIDPYLGRDLAFWTGWLPFERTIHEWAVTLAFLVGAAVLVLYALTPSVQVQRGRLHVSTWVRRHFAVYSAILLMLVAWGYRLDAFAVLTHGSGAREMFLAFDHRVMYPYLIAISLGTAAVGLFVAWSGWIGHQRATLTALLLVLVAGPMLRVALPLLDRRSGSERERAQLDRPYHMVRALYTRRAFGVDDIVRGASADSLRIAVGDLAHRVSAWDPAAIAKAAGDEPALQPLGGGAMWRVAGDSLRAVHAFGDDAVAAGRSGVTLREVDPSDADERGAPWPAEGAAVLTLPPLATGIDVPAIALASDTLGRVAAPRFGSGWRRVALAWGVRQLRLAMADADPRYARLESRRDVRDRVQALLPFFTLGATPQALVAHDSLWWTVELFNTSEDYPLTEPLMLGGRTQHMATPAGIALVNAHSGRVQVVLPERPDKMTRWWRDHLPALFVARHAIDGDVLAALPAPVDRAVVQGIALGRTGFRNDTLSVRPLYNADDADQDLLPGAPTPFVADVPAHPLAWGVPAVDGADRMRGVLVAVGGAQPHVALVEQADAQRWPTALDRLQRTADSAHISRGKRHPRRGRVQTIPTTQGMMFVQSFYEWAPERVPSLAGVVIAAGGGAHVGTTLSVALGGLGHSLPPDAGLRARLARVYAELQEARRRGDWSAFGRALDALGRLLEGH